MSKQLETRDMLEARGLLAGLEVPKSTRTLIQSHGYDDKTK